MYRSIRKRKTIIKILTALAIVAILLGGVYYVLWKHTVKTTIVVGSTHYSEDEIKAMVMKGPLGNNSLYLGSAYKNKTITGIPYIASMTVEVLSPDTIKITVFEKAFAGYVEYLQHFFYFDRDGIVIESLTAKMQGVPEITGVAFDHIVLDKALPVEDKEIFGRILNVTKTLNKNELSADRISFNSQGNMTIWFGRVRVLLGEEDNLEKKIGAICGILPQIAEKSGVLDLQNYEENKDSIPFHPDK